jgi:predicted histone-like DNA-binding protein
LGEKMAIYYVLRKKPNPNDLNAPQKYYAYPLLSGTYDMKKIAQKMSDMSSMSKADAYAFMILLRDLTTELLADGYAVEIDEFLSLRPTLSSEGARIPKEFRHSSIKINKVVIRQGEQLKLAMKRAKFRKEPNSDIE